MRISRTRAVIAATAIVLGGAGLASASTGYTPTDYQNGDFEDPSIASPWQTFNAGDTLGTNGWTVGGAGVDVVRAPDYPVHTGSQALDLNAYDAGSIAQTFATVPGHAYSVLYWVNSNAGGNDWNINVDVEGASIANGDGHWTGSNSAAHQFDANGWEQWGPPNMVASGSSMTVTLTSLDPATSGGVILDDIVVSGTNAAPVVDNQGASTNEDTASAPITLGPTTDADGDAVTYTVSDPPHGTAVVTGNQATYTPDSNYNGPDSFTATGTDGLGASDSGVITITVNAVPDASTLTNTKPSQGIWTNKKSTVVMHAAVTSTDPACVAGRTVTFTVSGGTLTTPLTSTGLTNSGGDASGKFTLAEGAYSVMSVLAATTACGGTSDTDPYVLTQSKK